MYKDMNKAIKRRHNPSLRFALRPKRHRTVVRSANKKCLQLICFVEHVRTIPLVFRSLYINYPLYLLRVYSLQVCASLKGKSPYSYSHTLIFNKLQTSSQIRNVLNKRLQLINEIKLMYETHALFSLSVEAAPVLMK